MGDVECLFSDDYARHKAEVLSSLSQHDVKVNRKAGGWLSKCELKSCLQQLFEGGRKSEAQLASLAAAVEMDDGTGDVDACVNYRQLLEDDQVWGPFVS